MHENRFSKRLIITVIFLFSIFFYSCFQTGKEFSKEFRKELNLKEIQGLIIDSKIDKGGFSFLITQNIDTTIIYSTGVVNPHTKFFVGDSIFKPKNQMIFTIKRKDSIFKYYGNTD